MAATREQALAEIRRRGRPSNRGLITAILLPAALALGAWALGQESSALGAVLLSVATMLLLIVAALWSLGGHLVRASRALEQGRRVESRVRLSTGDDGEGDLYLRYEHQGRQWECQVIPYGTPPTVGEHTAETYLLPGREAPVLWCIAEGVLLPRGQPNAVRR